MIGLFLDYNDCFPALNSSLFLVSLFFFFSAPEKPEVKLTVKDRNGIYVTWNKVDVHGPRTEYTVYLYEDGSRKAKGETSTYSYEFKGLSYSTEYKVEVSVGRPGSFQV